MPPLPPRPVRPVNRAGPKPQPPSQSRQLMVVESCLKAEAKNFDDGSTGAPSGRTFPLSEELEDGTASNKAIRTLPPACNMESAARLFALAPR